jgi:hypothetical protein
MYQNFGEKNEGVFIPQKKDGEVYALSEQPRGGFGVRYPGEEETERVE